MGAESRFSTPTHSIVSQSNSISFEKWSREMIRYKIGVNVQKICYSLETTIRGRSDSFGLGYCKIGFNTRLLLLREHVTRLCIVDNRITIYDYLSHITKLGHFKHHVG